VFRFEYNNTDYSVIIQEYAAAMGVTPVNGRVTLTPQVGKGYFQLINLPNSLQAIVSDYSINDTYYLKRLKSNNDYYILRFEEINIADKMMLRIESEELRDITNRHSGIYLTSCMTDVAYLATRGSSIRGINVLFSGEWLAKNLGITNDDEVLNAYLSLKTSSFNIEPIDAEYKKLFIEILEADSNNPMWMGIVQNRIMLIIERFFTHLYDKNKSLTRHVRISKHDIGELIRIEESLTKDITVSPPTIDELATEAAMSPAKLKRIFKEVYGSGVYSYYQKQRMGKAREMLLTGDFTVKEVGMHVGYSNLSNFATAFRKEFGILPSELRQAV
jgi:AraC-like DNA-binding protein